MNLDRAYIALVLRQPAIRWKYEAVTRADLTDEAARAALDAIEHETDSGRAVDLVSVTGRLRETGLVDIAQSLNSWRCDDLAPASVIRELKRGSHRHRLEIAARETIEHLDDGAAPEIAQERLERSLSEIGVTSDLTTPRSVTDELEENARAAHRGDPVPGVKTGLFALDTKLGALRNGSLVVIGARTSVGKTSLALTIAANLLAKGTPVGIVSLEETTETITARLASMRSGVSLVTIEEGHGDTPRLEAWTTALREVAGWPLHIADRGSSLAYIRASARKMSRGEGCRLLIVDYAQLIDGKAGQSDYARVSEASRAVKGLAKELSVPILLVAQLNRGAVEAEPKISDLRDSGQLEQDADAIVLLWRESEGPQVAGEDPTWRYLAILGKHRTRKPGPVAIRFDASRFRWEDDL